MPRPFTGTTMWKATAIISLSLLIVVLAYSFQKETIHSTPAKPNESVIAKIADRTITVEEIAKPIAPKVYPLEEKIYKMKRQQLQQVLNNILLEKEAARQGLSVQQLVDKEVLSKGIEISEEEVEAALKENRSNLPPGELKPEIKSKLIDYLATQKAYRSINDYANSLGSKFGLEIYLREPPLPEVTVTTGGDPVFGPGDAPVTVVEFSDYNCTACKQHHDTVQQLRKKYNGKIRWVFKHLPQDRENPSARAAEAALCAGDQGKFWEFNDLLFSPDTNLSPEQIRQYGVLAELDMDGFDRCVGTRSHQKDIERNMKEAREAGVSMTPSFVINGKLVQGGPTADSFSALVDKSLNESTGTGNKHSSDNSADQPLYSQNSACDRNDTF